MSMCGRLGRRSGVDEVQPYVEARRGQQEPGDELAGRRRVDVHLPAADVAVTADRERERPVPAVVDVHAEVAQRLDHLAHGTVQRALVRGEDDIPPGQSRQRRDEPHDRARLPAVDRDVSGQRRRGHREVVAELARTRFLLDGDAEGAQRFGHAPGAVGVQR
jgi:hypothetical protein